jgi:hypothetical protein
MYRESFWLETLAMDFNGGRFVVFGKSVKPTQMLSSVADSA